MSAHYSNRSRLIRRARSLGLSALVVGSIGVYSLYSRAASASNVDLVAQAATPTALYRDGDYTGDAVRAGRWGNLQVSVTIEGGAITDITLLQVPQSRSTSRRISQIALPYLIEEAIQAQSASIDIVSGATPTSRAFIQSLESALNDAEQGVSA